MADNKCEACGKETLVQKTVKDFAYPTPMGQVTIEGETPLEECTACGEIFLPGLLVEQWNRLILTHMLKKPDLLAHREVEFLYRVLPFTKDEFCQMLELSADKMKALATGSQKLDIRTDKVFKALVQDYLEDKHTVH